MNKEALIKTVANKTGFTQKNIKIVLNTLQDVVFSTIKTEEVKIMDGVTLSTVFKEETEGRSPINGEIIQIPAKFAPKCKFGTPIKSAINS